ncbi:hypothetical protein HGP28_15235 [Vibrio sp. SM6]|uniref:Uncharacterized protein n=1 Tax=Vibrio agarilyticus TaxID=2726741 RepID=A0A7X8TTF1_9VIBR|nr:hypothetical protein [Vibrio agarilyticus]NLS14237.1 hypothetical protein [Vibrio agarilyticus]
MSEILEKNIADILDHAPLEVVKIWQQIAIDIECPEDLRALKFVIHALESCANFKPHDFAQTFNIPIEHVSALFVPFSHIDTTEYPEYMTATLAKGTKSERPIYALLHQLNAIVDRYLANVLLVFLDHYFSNEAKIKNYNRDYQIFSAIRLLYTDEKFDRSCLSHTNPNDIGQNLAAYKTHLLGLEEQENHRQMLPHVRELIHFYHLSWKVKATRQRKNAQTIRSAYRRDKPERIIGSSLLTTFSLKTKPGVFHETHLENGVSIAEDFPPLCVINIDPSTKKKPSHELPDYSVLRDKHKEKAKAHNVQRSVRQAHNISLLARTVLQAHELTYLWQELYSTRPGILNNINKRFIRLVITICLMFTRELESTLQLQVAYSETEVDDGFLITSTHAMYLSSVAPTAQRTKHKENPHLLKTDGRIAMLLPTALHQQLHGCNFPVGSLKSHIGGVEKVRKAIDQLLATINKKHACQISLKRIENHLKNDVVSREQFDPVLLEPLSGSQSYYNRSPRHYAWYHTEEFAKKVALLWHHTFGLPAEAPRVKVSSNNDSSTTQIGFGSEFTPTLEVLQSLVNELESELDWWSAFEASQSLDNVLAYHNAYTLYTVYMLLSATGYRAVSNPLPTFSFALMRHNAICISDKDNSVTFAHMRVIPCPSVLKSQLGMYQTHLDALARLLAHNFPFESNQFCWHRSHLRFVTMTSKNARLDWHISAKNSQRNDGLFLFFKKKPDEPYRSTNAYPSSITNMSSHLPSLPLNFGRHYLRHYLQQHDVHQELIKFQMGHWVTGENPLEEFSSLCMQEAIEALLPTLDTMLSEIGWQARPSLLTRKRV